jgi:hypothetical protein
MAVALSGETRMSILERVAVGLLMHFGGAMFFTDYLMSAMELARALDERGFESVWAPEHSHIPPHRWDSPPEIRFAPDSPLEESGFEPSVPPVKELVSPAGTWMSPSSRRAHYI